MSKELIGLYRTREHVEAPADSCMGVCPWTLALHVELNEAASKHTQCADDANCHEDAQQNVIQHHGNKFPLLCSLERGESRHSSE